MTNATLNGATLQYETERKAAKLALRISQVVKRANGRIVKLEIIDAGNGVYWLYVNGGRREEIG